MRNLFSIVLLIGLFGAGLAQATTIDDPEELGCVQICPKLCVTVEQAAVSKFKCMPPTNKGQCAFRFSQCTRSGDTCTWVGNASYEACVAQAHD